MTTPCYPDPGCAAGSQVREEAAVPAAWSPASYAWIVNFNNGNANNNHRDNDAFVRAVRSVASPGECQGIAEPSLAALHVAWKAARASKRPSVDQLNFDTRWMDGLLQLQAELAAHTWSPRPSTCFIATRPKAREIHAPAFADRVVHHWLVPQLEAIFEPGFIHDSYANRVGKGSHAAVRRLQDFVRQVGHGQDGGWFLQLDIRNFFNSIHRPTLWRALRDRLQRRQASAVVQHATHALIRSAPLAAGVTFRATAEARATVPPHKRLENAAPGCGLPIGNLSSQFFANVYLDALDQFVKHTLRAPRYLRYVDDFVLVHRDRAQLEAWRDAIADFLRAQLRLELKPEIRLGRLADGIDFLGYVVRPSHTRVRRRVVDHAQESLAAFERAHLTRRGLRATPADLRRVTSVWASYEGHFRHANSRRLRASLEQRFPWLAAAVMRRRFDLALEGRMLLVPSE